VSFIHDTGAKGGYFMPENVGSGVALLDYDNDGRLDIYLVQNAGAESASRNRLFIRRPRADSQTSAPARGSMWQDAAWASQWAM
jgi:hypothetical protein